MNLSKDSAGIEATAAKWFAKRESGHWNAADQARLDAWLDSATAHRIAYVRIHAAWERSGRLNALGAGVPAGTIPPRDSWAFAPFSKVLVQATSHESLERNGVAEAGAVPYAAKNSDVTAARPSRFSLRWRAVAASLVLAAAVGSLWHFSKDGSGSYRTRVGAISTVPLPDGSRITLNTNSQIHVALNPTERRIELDHGEAFFEVAHDATRPFIVEIADKRVIAVGTKFSIRREDRDIRVLVTEGRVRIERIGDSTRTPQTQLAAGSEARTAQTAVMIDQPAPAEVDQLLSWRTGYITFRDTTLADAVADFNRYSDRKIVVEDPEIAGIRIGGNFRPDNVDAFLSLIQSGFPVHVEQQSDRIILTKR